MKYFFLILVFAFTHTAIAQDKGVTGGAEVYKSVELDTLPEYPGGIKEFYSYLTKNIIIPPIDKSMSAKILLTFVIEKDGSVSSVKTIRDPGYGLGDAAVKEVVNCPKLWAPGIINGSAVRAQYTLPININIDGPEKSKNN